MINVNLGSLCGHPISCPNVKRIFFLHPKWKEKNVKVQRSRARLGNRYIGIGGVTYTGDMT